jgi:RNA polymerase sigma-70 factor, ECF subfamily
MSDPQRPDDFDAWVASTVQRALAYAVSLVGNRPDAEDIVHDCYCRLLARADRYDLPRDGIKLLLKSITNACINRSRRKAPTVNVESVEHAEGSPCPSGEISTPDQQAMHNELEQAIAGALFELPVQQRAAVELRSLGHPLTEIAEMLEVSHANARVLLHRGRERLSEKLRPFLEDEP